MLSHRGPVHTVCHWKSTTPSPYVEHEGTSRKAGGGVTSDKGSGRGFKEAVQGRARGEIIKKFFYHTHTYPSLPKV